MRCKKRFTRLRVFCFRENIGEENKTCLQAYIFDNGVTLPSEESHFTPRSGVNLPPGWKPLTLRISSFANHKKKEIITKNERKQRSRTNTQHTSTFIHKT